MDPIIEIRDSATYRDMPLDEMRTLLAQAVVTARTKDPPGDGSMFSLDAEQEIGGGMWEGGWTLQATVIDDERRWVGPQVIVHAYRQDQLAQGSVRLPLEYTSEDRRALAIGRLERLRAQREQNRREDRQNDPGDRVMSAKAPHDVIEKIQEFHQARQELREFLADLQALEAVDAIEGDKETEAAIACAGKRAKEAAKRYVEALK